MSRTVVDLDDDALSLASEELGTTSKVATVNAALRRVANQRAAARMLELLDETGTDLSMRRCAGRGGTAAAVECAARGQVRAGMGLARHPRPGRVPDAASAHVIAACHMTALEICYSARGQKDLEALLAGERALEWRRLARRMDRALEVQRLLAQHRGNDFMRPIRT